MLAQWKTEISRFDLRKIYRYLYIRSKDTRN